MANLFTQLAYQTWQQTKNSFSLTHKTLSHQWFTLLGEQQRSSNSSISAATLLAIQQRFQDLLTVDWQEAAEGIYGLDLLFTEDWEQLWYYPLLWLDMPQVWQRRKQKQYQSFPPQIDLSYYPAYYRQNFHHQTDGYLSDRSAQLYDLQVDLLFNGAADAMRRRILAPLKTALAQWQISPQQIKILDVACGTGRTLKMIRHLCPEASLHGIDLSIYYLRRAQQFLTQKPGEFTQLIEGNAEKLPYINDYFHSLTSVFLFHELPPQARQRVIEECFRVLKPGGTLILCDSIQKEDVPSISPILEWFPQNFHEPYYQNYITDDLVKRLEVSGFTEIHTQTHYMSKYWIGQKPIIQ